MSDFVVGQRWSSNTESELGLGVILAVESRTVTVLFAASNNTRVYAKQDAPLTRVRFSVHDQVQSREGWQLTVDEVEEQHELLTYIGHRDDGTQCQLPEAELNNFIQLNRPQDRLFAGQLDSEARFILRYQTLAQLHKLTPSAVRGLAGARVSLIPHQLYIAHEVASRAAPRVLLADEVGLGKTIEAGLIIHQQLLTERAQRVLIVVPEPLLHQWLVEMLRRFNLRFSIFDEQRCVSLDKAEINPFETEQLILCSLEFLVTHPNRHAQALQSNWDLLVVDEAHHLHWSPQQPSMEYQCIERLAQNTKGVLLLTATPEQLGAASHFARLRLLDPDRFFSLDEFLEEERLYEPVVRATAELLESSSLSEGTIKSLDFALGEHRQYHKLMEVINRDSASFQEKHQARDQLVHLLVDRHGTGRVLFRNTRNAIQGFPQRQVHAYALAKPEQYSALINQALNNEAAREKFAQNFSAPFAQLILAPERVYQTLCNLGAAAEAVPNWTSFDPRFNWLTHKLKQLKKDKVLVICASADTALDLENGLRTRHGLRAAMFHEGLNIIERDRAAAYFADPEGGAQVLICSEIGSEGRNFQFSHHLILFDLPLNPDFLEQRIGRLDRIGQLQTIQIHIPYIKHSAQEVIYHWYHEGMNAFAQTCPAGQAVYKETETELTKLLQTPDFDKSRLDAMIAKTRPIYEQISHDLERGRDRLLELNSYRQDISEHIQTEIRLLDNNAFISDYMSRVFDAFGVDFEYHSEHSFVVKPSDHMLVHYFPELPEDGVTVTFDRNTALSHEDMLFLSWEHPMVTGAMDMVLSGEHGNTALSIIKHKGLATGDILLEAIFTVKCIAPHQLQLDRFLPPTVIRTVINDDLHDLNKQLPFSKLKALPVQLNQTTINQILRAHQKTLRTMHTAAETNAAQQLPEIISRASLDMQKHLTAEKQRLEALKQINPNVREEEIEFITQQLQSLTHHLQQAQLRLDSLRLIIAG